MRVNQSSQQDNLNDQKRFVKQNCFYLFQTFNRRASNKICRNIKGSNITDIFGRLRRVSKILILILFLFLFSVSTEAQESFGNNTNTRVSSSSDSHQTGNQTPIPQPHDNGSNSNSVGKKPLFRSFINVIGSLLLVLGIFLVLIWFLKKINPKERNLLSSDLIDCLGQYPLNSRNRLYLIVFGERLLLVSLGQEGIRVLSEITDRAEMERFILKGIKVFQKVSSPVIREIIAHNREHSREKGE